MTDTTRILIKNRNVPTYRNGYMGYYELDGIRIRFKPTTQVAESQLANLIKRDDFAGYLD